MRNTLRGVLRLIDHTRPWPVELEPTAATGLNGYADKWLRLAGQAAHNADAGAASTWLPSPGRTTQLLLMDWTSQGAVLAEQLTAVSGIGVNNPIGDALRRAITAGFAWRLSEVAVTGSFSHGTDAPHILGLIALMRRAAQWGPLAVSSHVPTFRHVTNALRNTDWWESGLATQMRADGDWVEQKGWIQQFTHRRTPDAVDTLTVSGGTELNAEPAFLLLNGRPYGWDALCNWMAGVPASSQ